MYPGEVYKLPSPSSPYAFGEYCHIYLMRLFLSSTTHGFMSSLGWQQYQLLMQGAQQLGSDVAAVCSVFQPYTPKPAAHFRESTESAKILSAEEATAQEGMQQLHLNASSLPEVFKQLGVVRLHPMQVAQLLAQRLWECCAMKSPLGIERLFIRSAY